jgi:hypothetical protein
MPGTGRAEGKVHGLFNDVRPANGTLKARANPVVETGLE